MAIVSMAQVSATLQREIAAIVSECNLPPQMAWPDGVTATGGDSVNDRWYDGRIWLRTRNGREFTLLGGVSVQGADIRWGITVETRDGIVTATPQFAVARMPEGDVLLQPPNALMIGFEPRRIACVGQLNRLFPEVDDVTEEFGLPKVYDTVERIIRARRYIVQDLSGR